MWVTTMIKNVMKNVKYVGYQFLFHHSNYENRSCQFPNENRKFKKMQTLVKQRERKKPLVCVVSIEAV